MKLRKINRKSLLRFEFFFFSLRILTKNNKFSFFCTARVPCHFYSCLFYFVFFFVFFCFTCCSVFFFSLSDKTVRRSKIYFSDSIGRNRKIYIKKIRIFRLKTFHRFYINRSGSQLEITIEKWNFNVEILKSKLLCDFESSKRLAWCRKMRKCRLYVTGAFLKIDHFENCKKKKESGRIEFFFFCFFLRNKNEMEFNVLKVYIIYNHFFFLF